ncbi:MAG TPA: damage-inducible protein CinA [Lachnospiraceae bacterium]|nr:damage-inducible protein CinA [Lachnospiraceae bacterium]
MEIAEKIVNILKEQGLHISTAESLTGGMLASSIVDIGGASEVFEEGYITYSDAVKHKVLGVSKDCLEKYTAVSSVVAKQMAEGTAQITGSDITVATTGYAGPGNADDGTPAGTVYIGVFYKEKTDVRKFCFDGDRNSVRRQTVSEALKMAAEKLA